MKDHLESRLKHLTGNMEIMKSLHKDLETTQSLKYQLENEIIIREQQIKSTKKRIEEIPIVENKEA